MSRELVQKTIDDKSYEFEQYNTTKSLKTLSQLTRLIGEPILLMIASGLKDRKPEKAGKKKSLLDTELDNDLLAKAIKELVIRMGDDDDVLSLVKKLAIEGVLCDSKQIVFDLHYSGGEGLAHLFKVVRAALEVQYGNFIAVLTESVGTLSPQPSKGIKSA